MGIYNPVYVLTTGPVMIRYPFARPGFSGNQVAQSSNPLSGAVTCTLSVQLKNGTGFPVSGDLHWVIDTGANQITIDSTVTVAANDTPWVTIGPQNRASLFFANPRFWYPLNYGKQDMYHVRVSYTPTGLPVSDSSQFNFGIRTVYAIRGNSSTGLQVYINGVSFKERGGSWGMDDGGKHWNHHAMEAKVRYHVDTNLNAIRNWIGGMDDDYFYQLCDAYGIFVWDDFWCPHSADGPSDLGTTIDTVLWLDRTTEKMKTYRDHPSILFWNSRNEVAPITALWNGLLFRARALDGSGDFATAGYTNPGPRIVQQSSGTIDVHSGGPYSYLTPEQSINNVTGFQTELGGTIMPNIESERNFIFPSMDANYGTYSWDVGGYHDWCNMNGHPALFTDVINQRLYNINTVANSAPLTPSLDAFCRYGQLFNFESYRAAYEAMNTRLGTTCDALCYWMSDPAWPSMMWQSYDYYLDPNASIYGSRHANEPKHVQYFYLPGVTTSTGNKGYTVVNQTYTPLTNVTARCRVFDMNGTLALTDQQTFTNVPVDTSIGGSLLPTLPSTLSTTYIVDMRLTNASGQVLSNTQYIQSKTTSPQPDWTGIMTMPKAVLTVTNPSASAVFSSNLVNMPVSGPSLQDSLKFTLKNNSSPVAVMVRLKLVRQGYPGTDDRVLPVHYSDNYVTIPPGDSDVLSIDFYDSDLKGYNPKLVMWGFNTDSVIIPVINPPVAIRAGGANAIRQAGMYTSLIGKTLRLHNVAAGTAWEVKLFDLAGRLVLNAQGAKGQAAVVSLSRVHAGAYVAVAKSAGATIRNRIMLAN